MLKLLIVDDEAHWVESMAVTIPWDSIGIQQVFKAYSAIEAIEIMKEHPIDIVITDIRMPEMSGLELIVEIRRMWARTKCLVLTGHADFDYAKQALQFHVFDYLLKPTPDEVLINSVKNLIQQIQEESDQISSYKMTMDVLKENLPLLKNNLFQELLLIRDYSQRAWEEKKSLLHIPFDFGDVYSMIMLRTEGEFEKFKQQDARLIEFAILNIAGEIFNRHFELWYARDPYGYLVFIVKLRESTEQLLQSQNVIKEERQQLIERAATRLQHNIKVFLKGRISLLFGEWHIFPQHIQESYQNMLSAFRNKIGNDEEFFINVIKEEEPHSIIALTSIYEPPTLIHLLDSGRWESISPKLERIFEELNQKEFQTQEHLVEAYLHILSAFIYFAHRNNHTLSGLVGESLSKPNDTEPMRSIQQLKFWAYRVIEVFKNDIFSDMKRSRASIVQRVQQYMEENISGDVSLKTLADFVYLHRTHLSKIYKLETGEGLSNYLYRIRMEKSIFLLKDHNLKIYEIGEMIGLPNTPYFIKIFKNFYGVTPQEFRDR